MIKIRLYAAAIGVGLGLLGAPPAAQAGGHFHKSKVRQSYSYSGPMMATSPFALAAPMVNTQAFAFSAPAIANPVYSFAAPMASTQAFSLTSPALATQSYSLAPFYSQSASAYAVAPVALPSSQFQAQAFSAVPQFGLSDVEVLFNLLGRLRNTIVGGGNVGGIVNPCSGADIAGSQPIEVKVTIIGEGAEPPSSSSPSPKPDRAGKAIENEPLDQMLRQIGALQVHATLQAAVQASAAVPGALPRSIDEQLKGIADQLSRLEQNQGKMDQRLSRLEQDQGKKD